LGSVALKEYLINFARSFIYTTALPPHSLATITGAYDLLFSISGKKERELLLGNIHFFNEKVIELNLKDKFIVSSSVIHCCIIPGNEAVKKAAKKLQEKGFGIKPILSPTVPKGEERLRICLHSYNTEKEISEVLKLLSILVKYE